MVEGRPRDDRESPLAIFKLLQQPLQGPQNWNVSTRGFPHDVGVDVEVPVNQDIPHADDIRPRDVGGKDAHILRETVRRLAEDLQMAKNQTWSNSSRSNDARSRSR